MEITQDYLENIVSREPTTDAPHERADLVQQFVDGINENINDEKYKPVTFGQINGQLRHHTISALYRLLDECENARNFGALFWWKLKQNK